MPRWEGPFTALSADTGDNHTRSRGVCVCVCVGRRKEGSWGAPTAFGGAEVSAAAPMGAPRDSSLRF